MSKKFGILTSSQNPDEIANKVKGAVLLFSSVIILIASRFFHLELSANDISSLATEVSGVAGAVWVVYGFILHAIAWFYARKNVPSVPAA